MGVALSIVVFIILLSFLVICHEMGHFAASRKAGVVVQEFGVGLGPRLFSVKRGETTYSINLVPIGAFVRPVGEDDPTVEGGLAGKGPWARMGVYAAGPLVNLGLAFLLLAIFFMVVVSASIVGNEGLMVQSVNEGSAAADAGIQPGDVIVQIGDAAIEDSGDVQDAIGQAGQTATTVILQRGGVDIPVTLTPTYDDDLKRYIMGVSLSGWLGMVTEVAADSPAAGRILPGDTIVAINGKLVYGRESVTEALRKAADSGKSFKVELQRIVTDEDAKQELKSEKITLDPGALSEGSIAGVTTQWVEGATLKESRRSVGQALRDTVDFFVDLPRMIWESIPIMKEDPSKAMVGPVGAGQLTVETVELLGYTYVLYLGGMISLGVAMFNFIPFPPLDGGGMVIGLIEGIRRGKRLPQKAVRATYIVGWGLMILLFVLVFSSDISRVIKGEGFLGL
jgi:regulator of sigma E protease